MYKAIRITLTLAALSAAVASQALTINYAGNGAKDSGNTVSLGYLGDDFSFATSTGDTASGTVTLLDALGTSGLVLTLGADQDASAIRYSGVATATGFGNYASLVGSDISVVSNNKLSYTLSVQGEVEAVPEPASIAALGVGAVALLRRRNKKA
ncbi:PEP-CTERM sorting domain-containing protein [bacterium]|nr:MAG: PEP-CTERM sorting domain-containing protein [bacterium]